MDANSITTNTYAGLVAASGTNTGNNIITRNTFSGTAYILNSANNTYGPFVDMHTAGGQIGSTSRGPTSITKSELGGRLLDQDIRGAAETHVASRAIRRV